MLGSDKNLSNLAFNPEHGGDVTIRVANKVVSIYLDGKKVLTTQYKQSIGEVMGIKFVFNGIGKVVSPQLQDLKTKEIF